MLFSWLKSVCVCVSNGLIVLQFLESLTEITSTPAAPVGFIQ